MSKHRKRNPRVLTAALAFAVGAALFVVGQSTASGDGTIPTPVATASPNSVVVCDPASIAPDGSFSLPCFGPSLPNPETTTVTVTTPVPVPTTVTQTVTQTVTVTPAPPTTTPPATTSPPVPTRPGASNTGVPDGVTLTAYTGPCTITAANTSIVARLVTCSPLSVRAPGVTIADSRVNGVVTVPTGSVGTLVMTDSEIAAPAGQTGIDGSNYTLNRVDVFGGNRQGNCDRNCTVNASWLHGTRLYPASQHASGFRMGQYTTLTGNTITCEAAQNSSGGGCSAPITGYPDTMPIHHNMVVGNWIPGSPHSAFCAYGGNSQGKPYSNDSTNATYVVFRDNVFGRGTTGKCAMYGPISDFASGRTGNVWSNNRYEDGALI